MIKIKKIVVPCDFSKLSKNALNLALFLSESFDADLTVVHARVLFADNPDIIMGEFEELKEAVSQNNHAKVDEEFGDLLFSLVNLSRFLHVNPEDSLRSTIEKFIYRFQKIEKELKERNKTLEESSLEEMDEIWERAKKTT